MRHPGLSFTVRATLVDSQGTENRLKRQKDLKVLVDFSCQLEEKMFSTNSKALRDPREGLGNG